MSRGLYVLIRIQEYTYLGSNSLPWRVYPSGHYLNLPVEFLTLNSLEDLRTYTHLTDPTSIVVGSQFDKDVFQHEILVKSNTISALHSIGFGYINGITPLGVLKDLYVKLSEFWWIPVSRILCLLVNC